MREIRTPNATDAVAVHRLVLESEALEANSLYAYLLVCTHFADTSVVALAADGDIDGFVAAYRPPARPESVFVWQIGVRERARHGGLATTLLDAVLAGPACRDVRYLEATVTPSNFASDKLFRGLARRRDVPCRIEDFLTTEHFGSESHEPERLYRIGPLSS